MIETARSWTADSPPDAVASGVVAAGRTTLVTSAEPKAVGDGLHWTPTELLAAALSGCLLHATLDVARRSRVPLLGWHDRVRLHLDRTEGPALRVVAAAVAVTVTVAKGVRPERAERIVHKAHRLCTIASSLSAPVEVRVTVVVSA